MSRVDEIRARLAAATSQDVWPIEREEDGDCEESPSDLMMVTRIGLLHIEGHAYSYDYSGDRECRADAIALIEADCALVSNAPSDLAYLLEDNARLQAALDEAVREQREERADALEAVRVMTGEMTLMIAALCDVEARTEGEARDIARRALAYASRRDGPLQCGPMPAPGEPGDAHHRPAPPNVGTLDMRIARVLVWASDAVAWARDEMGRAARGGGR